MEKTRTKWICQLYLYSFFRSYGSKSLRKIRNLLKDLKEVGFAGVYLIALWQDGGADNGFDVVDYTVNPKFGTDKEFMELIKEAHRLGLTVGVDVVPNHVSDQHILAKNCLEGVPGYEDCLYVVTKDEAKRLTAAGVPSFFGELAYSDFGDKYVRSTFVPRRQLNLNWKCQTVRDYFKSVFRNLESIGIDFVRVDCGMMLLEDVSAADPNNPMACMRPLESVNAIREVAGNMTLFFEWFDPRSSVIFKNMPNCYALDCQYVIQKQNFKDWQEYQELIPLLGGHDQMTLADRGIRWKNVFNLLLNTVPKYVFLDIQTLIGWTTDPDIYSNYLDDKDVDAMLRCDSEPNPDNQRYRGRRPIKPVVSSFRNQLKSGKIPKLY